MMMEQGEYKDSIILALRQKYEEERDKHRAIEQERGAGEDIATVRRVSLLEGKCSILLPESMTDMGEMERMVKYRNRNKPLLIKTDEMGDATIIFHMLPKEEKGRMDIGKELEEIRGKMRRIWKQNVFYDTGKVLAGELQVAWMDFRTFCLDGSLYCLLFLFEAGELTVLGNFHCSFPKYDMWKPVILKLLTTIETDAETRRKP